MAAQVAITKAHGKAPKNLSALTELAMIV